MKILYLSRYFREGEAATEHVKTLASKAADRGHEPVVVSFDDESFFQIDDRVKVHRVKTMFEADNLYNWAMMMNNELKNRGRQVFDGRKPDVIHAVDWTAFPSAVSLSKSFESPLIVSFQSTENERGFSGDHAALISELEWQATYEAEKVIAAGEDTKNSVIFDLEVPEEKLEPVYPFSESWEEKVMQVYKELKPREVENK